MDNDRVNFDKYMDKILLDEERRKAAARRGKEHCDETPQRKYIKRYRETPGNRIRYGGKR